MNFREHSSTLLHPPHRVEVSSLEAQYEVQKTGLQVKLLQDEDIDYPNFPEVFKELDPFDKGVEG